MRSRRIEAGVERLAPFEMSVDGERVLAHPGECVAAALIANGILKLRRSPRTGAPRGAFCMMGVCQECVVGIDGVLSQSCLVPSREGMEITLG